MMQRLGIVGGGQLGRMLGFAAKQLGFYVTVIDPTPGSPAGQVVDKQIVAAFADESAIQQLAAESDFLTFEVELANSDILYSMENRGIQINPSPLTLSIIKDKLRQKEFLLNAKLPIAPFLEVHSADDISQAAIQFGYPLVLKARLDAYDGRGNIVINKPGGIPGAIRKLTGRKLYVEKFIPFSHELAIMVARSINGEIKTYPVVETVHKHNICHTVFVPARVTTTVRKQVVRLARRTMKHLQGAGVFGIEFFLTNKNMVVINEIAPRVHNSGHYTAEACVTSQFEQHVRAVTGLPLGSTALVVPAAVMVNILGERQGQAVIQGLDKALRIPQVSVHIYGKAETKFERKMGHITATDTTVESAYRKAFRARKYMSI